MNNAIVGRALPRLPLATTILCMACSGGADDRSGGPVSPAPEPVQRAQSALSSSAGGGAASASTNSTWAAAISMAPWTQCTVYPDGASSNDNRTAVIQAGADGEARFFPPASSWGTKLILKCSLNGNQSQHVVDLNDSSTFTREAGSDLDARPNGMRPALTGDLSAISQSALLQQGYPQRPDPVRSPGQYANWVKSVTNQSTKFTPVGVASLDTQMTGTFVGNVGCSPWTGLIQAAANFARPGSCATNYPEVRSEVYQSYFAITSEPWFFNCDVGNCETGLWAGIGGDTVTGVSNVTALIQNGFVVGLSPTIMLMWEYWYPGENNTPTGGGLNTAPLPSGWSSGDEIWVWGWAAPSNSCGLDATAAPWACFEWEDRTTFTVAGPVAVQNPSGTSTWLPSTFQFIAEVPNGQNNASYGDVVMQYAWAYDQNGAEHPDPGQSSATDPYVYAQTNAPSGDPYSNGQWYNGTVSVPDDPFTIWDDEEN
jgi:hypothetical protein